MNKFKSDKKTRNIGLAVLGCLFVIIIAIAIIASAGNTIKLTDYITAEVIGIDGYGTVQFDINEEKLYEDVFGTAPADTYENLAKLLQYEEKCDNLMDCITILEVEGNGTFANNDTALIEITFENNENKFGKSIKGGTFKYKISGLEKGEVVDPFSEEYVDISFDGVNRFGTVVINKKSNDNWLYATTYSVDKEENLSNGDEIVITAEINDSYDTYMNELLEDGKIIKQVTTITKKVSDLKTLATAENLNNEYIKKAIDKATLEINEYCTGEYEYRNIKMIGVLFEDKIDKTESEGGGLFKSNPRYNNLTVYFEYEVKLLSSWYTRSQEYSFIDIEVDSDGNLSELGDPIDTAYLDYEKMMWVYDEDFTLTQLEY